MKRVFGATRLQSRAWWIAAGYALVATLYIYFSDKALGLLIPDRDILVRWSVAKGFAYVIVTSLLLFFLTRRAFGALEASFTSLKITERQLRSSEQQLAAIIDSAMDAIITLDAARNVVIFNRAAEKMFGCEKSEVVQQPIERFLPELRDTTEGSVIMNGVRQNGEVFPIEASLSRIRSGEQKLVTVILRDISRRKASADEINRLKRLYAALRQINHAIMWPSTREELFQKVCQTLVEQGGFRIAWIGWRFPGSQQLVPLAECGDASNYLKDVDIYVDERPAGMGPSGRAFREGRPCICHDMLNEPSLQQWKTKIQAAGFRSTAVFPIRFKGEVTGTLAVYADDSSYFQDKEIELLQEAATDISFALDNFDRENDRQQAQEIARREKLFSDAMIDSMPGIVYLYNDQGKFIRWNKNFEAVSGYSHDEIERMHPLEFFSCDEKRALEERIAEVFAKGESSVEASFAAKDGTLTPYFFTGKRVVFDHTICLVGVGIDIGDRKRAEMALRVLNQTLELEVSQRTEELRTALARAESADRIKSAFLATMSHELRTPLNSIIGFTGIILQGLAGPLNPEQTKQLGMVRGSARHLLELINDVLDLSKIEAGQLEVRPERFDLRESVERVVASVKPLTEKKNLELVTQIAPDIREMWSDRRRVEQILLNLLNNAIKFSDRGTVTLTASWREGRPGTEGHECSPAVVIRVSDTGIGIKPENLSALFQPFRQIDTGLARQHEGTGLGLAICRRLATLLGGEIAAKSEWAKGSEFTVILPPMSKN